MGANKPGARHANNAQRCTAVLLLVVGVWEYRFYMGAPAGHENIIAAQHLPTPPPSKVFVCIYCLVFFQVR